MEKDMDQKFKIACERVKKFSKRPPDADLLDLYSYYKQATIGDVNIPKPSDQRGKAKWEAWNGRKGVVQLLAKEKYVELANKLASKFE